MQGIPDNFSLPMLSMLEFLIFSVCMPLETVITEYALDSGNMTFDLDRL